MAEPRRQYQPVDILEFRRRLQARVESAQTSAEDPLAELARIVGGDGHIVSADADPRGTLRGHGAHVEAPAARPPETDLEPIHWPDENPSLHYSAVDPPLDNPTEWGADVVEEWRSDEDTLSHENENLLVAPADRAHLLLHNRKRRSVSLYTTAAAIVIVGGLAVLFVRAGGHAGSAADRRIDTAALVAIPPVGANSARAATNVPGPSSAPTVVADADAGAQLTGLPLKPGIDTGAASSVAPVAPTNPPASSPDNNSLFLQPRRVRTVPVYGDGTLGNSSPNTMSSETLNAPVPGLTLGQVVEAQTLQNTASAAPPAANANSPVSPPSPAANRSPPVSDGAAPAAGSGKRVAALEPAKTPARSTTAPPRRKTTAAGATYTAVLASLAAESEAHGMLVQLQRKYGAALGGHRLTYHRVKNATGTVYQIRVAGLADDEAQALCTKLGNAGASCQVRQ